jgi:hypothetical protein
MLGLIFQETQRYQYLLVRREGGWVSLHLCSFVFVVYVIFILFCYIYHFFYYARVFDRYVFIVCICGTSATR